MLWSLMLATAALAGPGPGRPATVTVAVDSSKHELTITAGPYDLPNMPPMDGHAMMDLGMSHDTPVQHFEWPIDGWFRGFRVALADAQGHEVPRHVMHHLIMVNFSRRQLIQPKPSTTGAESTRGFPSSSNAMLAPTMSTMESTAPTSWKCTCSGGLPWILPSASAMRWNTAMDFFFTQSESGLWEINCLISVKVRFSS